jgi:acyl carrier protein
VTTSLTPDEARQVVLASIVAVAPEVEPDDLDESAPLRGEVDLDSMDFLTVLQHIHDRTGVEIPESDYARLITLSDFVDYLATR